VYNTTVEQYFRSIRDVVEDSKGVLELVVVVVAQSLDPGLDFLQDICK
jgi:hypothetical protein